MTPLCMPPVGMIKSRQDYLINHRFYQQPIMLTSNNYMVSHAREWTFPRVGDAMNLTTSHKFCRPTMSPGQGTSIKALELELNVEVPPLSGENALVVVESVYQSDRFVLPVSLSSEIRTLPVTPDTESLAPRFRSRRQKAPLVKRREPAGSTTSTSNQRGTRERSLSVLAGKCTSL